MKTKKPFLLRACILLCVALLPVACAPATPVPTPTQDVALINTSIAATIYTRLTQEATPTFTVTPTLPPTATNTPVPPTETPAPTATVGTPVPTATVPIIGDGARFLTTSPAQYAEIEPNHFYNLEFDLLNVGTTTWKSGYALVWVGGDQFTSVTTIPLDRDVAPGQKGIFILGTFGSEVFTPHTTYWQLYNDRGIAVPGGRVYFTYKPV
jgi:hypothetical protein